AHHRRPTAPAVVAIPQGCPIQIKHLRQLVSNSGELGFPGHALTPDEPAQILALANEPRFACVRPVRRMKGTQDEEVLASPAKSSAKPLRKCACKQWPYVVLVQKHDLQAFS
ncbi:MAG: hypothetical protein KA959_08160, partial [Polaromonas sp.]|nr:hypothetical protein [Polaromonas sp.]